MSPFLNRIPIFLLLSRGWHFARGYRRVMVFYFFLFALAQAMALSEPYVIGQLLNNVQTGIAHGSGSVSVGLDARITQQPAGVIAAPVRSVLNDAGASREQRAVSRQDAGAPRTVAAAPRTDAGAPRTVASAPRTVAGAPTVAPKMDAAAQEAWKNVSFYLLVYLATQVLFWLFHGPGRVIERYVAFHIKANYKAYLFGILTEMPLQWHREHHSGESIDKINKATNSLALFFDESFQISYMLFRLVGANIFLFCFLPYAGWVALGTTIAAFVVLALFDRYLYKQYDTLNGFENAVASAVHDYVTNIGSVITLRLESRVLREVKARIAVAVPLFSKNITIHEIKWFITTLMITFMIVTVLWHYAYGALSAGTVILGGSFFTLFEYLRRIGESFYDFAALYGTVVKQSADVQGADTIVGAQIDKVSHTGDELPADWKAVAVTGLHFKYEDEKHRVHHLEDLSVVLERGRSIALVGESGCGKSTLLSLLRGVQQAETVIVTSDGQLMSGKLRSLNAVTTLVPQDPEIFADTIRFNITFGLEVDDEEVMRCIRLARFESVLQRLPKGLDTNIAEKGVNMSGGEKQRLALARGIHFAKDSSIVLLDEPTSSVDTYNERLIYANLLGEFHNKCVISSVHKLHLLEMFDYIYVLDDGRIVEQGDFESLLDHGGTLARMWKYYNTSDAEDMATAAKTA